MKILETALSSGTQAINASRSSRRSGSPPVKDGDVGQPEGKAFRNDPLDLLGRELFAPGRMVFRAAMDNGTGNQGLFRRSSRPAGSSSHRACPGKIPSRSRASPPLGIGGRYKE